MLRPVQARLRLAGVGGLWAGWLAVLLMAVGSTAAWCQQGDDFRRDFGWLRSLGDEGVSASQCRLRPSSAVAVRSVDPNALARARALADAAASGASPVPGDRPAVADNSTLMYFPPIGDQPIGDCTCWAAGYYYNTYTQARDEGLDASGGDPDVVCSPRFLFSLICQGHYGAECTEHAMARLAEVGCANVSFHPMNQDYHEWPDEAAWVQALVNRTMTLHKIRADSTDGLEAIKQHIANGGCVVTRAVVSNNFDLYPDNGVLGIDNRVWYSRELDLVSRHSVCIVGYDDNKSYVDHRDGLTHYGAFLIAQTSGPSWGWYNSTGTGTKGFIWMAYRMFLPLGPPINRGPEFGYYDDPWVYTDPCYDNAPHPEVYYHDDRPQYRPKLYAVTGINHAERNKIILTGGIGPTDPADFDGPQVIQLTKQGALAITESKPVAVDLTDGVELLSPKTPTQVFVSLTVDTSASSSGTITSADFYQDADGDGVYYTVASTDPPVTVPPIVDENTGYATVQLYAPHYVYADDSNTTPPWEGTLADPYQTIQDAIDSAPTGAFICALPGTYNEGVVLADGVHLVGSGAHLTTVDSLNSDEAICASGVSSATVEDFTIIGGADYHAVRSTNSTLSLERCVITASKNGCGVDGGGVLALDNCLVAGHVVSGLWQNGPTTDVELANCTVCDNGSYGIARWGSGSAKVTITDTIVTGNGDDIAGDSSGYAVTYSDVGDGDFAGSDGNITADPQFVSGPYHSYYLSQTAAGQGSDSPCVDAGSDTAANLGLDGTTTRTDAVPDAGTVDMGYHAWPQPVIIAIERAGDDVVITWNARSGASYVVEWSLSLSAWNEVPVGEESSWMDTDTGSYGEKFYRVREDTFDGGEGGSPMSLSGGDGEAALGSSNGSSSGEAVLTSDAEPSGPGNVRRGAGNVGGEAGNVDE
jgi:hypothetical protein